MGQPTVEHASSLAGAQRGYLTANMLTSSIFVAERLWPIYPPPWGIVRLDTVAIRSRRLAEVGHELLRDMELQIVSDLDVETLSSAAVAVLAVATMDVSGEASTISPDLFPRILRSQFTAATKTEPDLSSAEIRYERSSGWQPRTETFQGFAVPADLRRLAHYWVSGETALVEESPPRRTSPAAVEASKLASHIMVAGMGSTGVGAGVSVLATGEHGPVIVVIGALTTLFMSVGGAAITLLTHKAALLLDLPEE